MRRDTAHGAEHALDPHRPPQGIEELLFMLVRDARVVTDADARDGEVERVALGPRPRRVGSGQIGKRRYRLLVRDVFVEAFVVRDDIGDDDVATFDVGVIDGRVLRRRVRVHGNHRATPCGGGVGRFWPRRSVFCSVSSDRIGKKRTRIVTKIPTWRHESKSAGAAPPQTLCEPAVCARER